MQISVKVEGLAALEDKMAAAPVAIAEGMKFGTRAATDYVAQLVSALTPIYGGRLYGGKVQGALAAGWKTSVRATKTGATGTIREKEYYGRFVDRGTKWQKAQRFVAESEIEAEPEVVRIIEDAVRASLAAL